MSLLQETNCLVSDVLARRGDEKKNKDGKGREGKGKGREGKGKGKKKLAKR
jgi:hypothetical protein